MSGENLLPGSQVAAFWLCPHTVGGGQGAVKALISFTRFHPQDRFNL